MIIPVCSPTYELDNFRLIEKTRRRDTETNMLRDKHGDILADAKYLVCNNIDGIQTEMYGSALYDQMKLLLGTTFIPWVLARITIIPL